MCVHCALHKIYNSVVYSWALLDESCLSRHPAVLDVGFLRIMQNVSDAAVVHLENLTDGIAVYV